VSAIEGRHALGCNLEEAFRPSAALGGWIAKMGLHETFRLQAIEGGIDGADRHLTPDARFNLLPHGDPIGPIGKTQERQEDDVFKFTEVMAIWH
jgi:hypothetical protein